MIHSTQHKNLSPPQAQTRLIDLAQVDPTPSTAKFIAQEA